VSPGGRGSRFGPAPASVTGATVTARGTVIVTGCTGAAGHQQPYLALAPPGQAARAVPVATIPGATISQVSVDAVAVSGNRRVAVGEAGGSPAIWTATGSSWSSASAGLAPAPATTPAPAVVVWTSADGSAWTTQIPRGPGLSGAGIQEITGLAASGDGALVGVGFAASASGEQPTVWNVPAR
jgi:hypothetical protein